MADTGGPAQARLLDGWPVLAIGGSADSGSAGRSVVTRAPVKAGDTLLVAAPFAAAVDASFVGSVCAACGSQAADGGVWPTRCPTGCAYASFCSPACVGSTLGKRHAAACGAGARVTDALLARGVSPHETATARLLLTALLAAKEPLPPSDSQPDLPGQLGALALAPSGAGEPAPTPPSFRDVMSQSCHPASPPARATTLAGHINAVLAALPASVVFGPPKPGTPLPKLPTSDEVTSLALRDACNGFAMWSGVGGAEWERAAVVCAPGAALFNHSCLPTAAKVQAGFSVRFVALRDMEAGEEVSICYVPVTDGAPKRADVLKAHFSFACKCSRCASEAGGAVRTPPCAHVCGGVLYPVAGKPPGCRRCAVCRRDVAPGAPGIPPGWVPPPLDRAGSIGGASPSGSPRAPPAGVSPVTNGGGSHSPGGANGRPAVGVAPSPRGAATASPKSASSSPRIPTFSDDSAWLVGCEHAHALTLTRSQSLAV